MLALGEAERTPNLYLNFYSAWRGQVGAQGPEACPDRPLKLFA